MINILVATVFPNEIRDMIDKLVNFINKNDGISFDDIKYRYDEGYIKLPRSIFIKFYPASPEYAEGFRPDYFYTNSDTVRKRLVAIESKEISSYDELVFFIKEILKNEKF